MACNICGKSSRRIDLYRIWIPAQRDFNYLAGFDNLSNNLMQQSIDSVLRFEE